MKLKENHINKLSALVLENLRNKDYLEFKEKEGVVLGLIKTSITKNLREEELLDMEVKKIMESYSRQMEAGEVDSRKVFGMIKSKLAKEKGIVL